MVFPHWQKVSVVEVLVRTHDVAGGAATGVDTSVMEVIGAPTVTEPVGVGPAVPDGSATQLVYSSPKYAQLAKASESSGTAQLAGKGKSGSLPSVSWTSSPSVYTTPASKLSAVSGRISRPAV